MMKNFLRNMDLEQVKDQISDIKDQMQDIRFRKPWTAGSDSSPMAFMAIGAALALLGTALYRNREEVANFCSSCGAEVKDRWQSSGMKEKAERMMSKMKNGAQDSKSQPNYQPG